MNFDKNKINEIIENFVSTKVLDKGITSNTIKAYKKDLNLFTNWCLNNQISLIEAQKKDINLYIHFLKEQNLNSSSINRKLSVIKSFYDYLYQINLINLNELKTIATQKLEKNLPKLLSEKEILHLIDKSKEMYVQNPTRNISYLRIQVILEFLFLLFLIMKLIQFFNKFNAFLLNITSLCLLPLPLIYNLSFIFATLFLQKS